MSGVCEKRKLSKRRRKKPWQAAPLSNDEIKVGTIRIPLGELQCCTTSGSVSLSSSKEDKGKNKESYRREEVESRRDSTLSVRITASNHRSSEEELTYNSGDSSKILNSDGGREEHRNIYFCPTKFYGEPYYLTLSGNRVLVVDPKRIDYDPGMDPVSRLARQECEEAERLKRKAVRKQQRREDRERELAQLNHPPPPCRRPNRPKKAKEPKKEEDEPPLVNEKAQDLIVGGIEVPLPLCEVVEEEEEEEVEEILSLPAKEEEEPPPEETKSLPKSNDTERRYVYSTPERFDGRAFYVSHSRNPILVWDSKRIDYFPNGIEPEPEISEPPPPTDAEVEAMETLRLKEMVDPLYLLHKELADLASYSDVEEEEEEKEEEIVGNKIGTILLTVPLKLELETKIEPREERCTEQKEEEHNTIEIKSEVPSFATEKVHFTEKTKKQETPGHRMTQDILEEVSPKPLPAPLLRVPSMVEEEKPLVFDRHLEPERPSITPSDVTLSTPRSPPSATATTAATTPVQSPMLLDSESSHLFIREGMIPGEPVEVLGLEPEFPRQVAPPTRPSSPDKIAEKLKEISALFAPSSETEVERKEREAHEEYEKERQAKVFILQETRDVPLDPQEVPITAVFSSDLFSPQHSETDPPQIEQETEGTEEAREPKTELKKKGQIRKVIKKKTVTKIVSKPRPEGKEDVPTERRIIYRSATSDKPMLYYLSKTGNRVIVVDPDRIHFFGNEDEREAFKRSLLPPTPPPLIKREPPTEVEAYNALVNAIKEEERLRKKMRKEEDEIYVDMMEEWEYITFVGPVKGDYQLGTIVVQHPFSPGEKVTQEKFIREVFFPRDTIPMQDENSEVDEESEEISEARSAKQGKDSRKEHRKKKLRQWLRPYLLTRNGLRLYVNDVSDIRKLTPIVVEHIGNDEEPPALIEEEEATQIGTIDIPIPKAYLPVLDDNMTSKLTQWRGLVRKERKEDSREAEESVTMRTIAKKSQEERRKTTILRNHVITRDVYCFRKKLHGQPFYLSLGGNKIMIVDPDRIHFLPEQLEKRELLLWKKRQRKEELERRREEEEAEAARRHLESLEELEDEDDDEIVPTPSIEEEEEEEEGQYDNLDDLPYRRVGFVVIRVPVKDPETWEVSFEKQKRDVFSICRGRRREPFYFYFAARGRFEICKSRIRFMLEDGSDPYFTEDEEGKEMEPRDEDVEDDIYAAYKVGIVVVNIAPSTFYRDQGAKEKTLKRGAQEESVVEVEKDEMSLDTQVRNVYSSPHKFQGEPFFFTLTGNPILIMQPGAIQYYPGMRPISHQESEEQKKEREALVEEESIAREMNLEKPEADSWRGIMHWTGAEVKVGTIELRYPRGGCGGGLSRDKRTQDVYCLAHGTEDLPFFFTEAGNKVIVMDRSRIEYITSAPEVGEEEERNGTS